MKPEASTRRLNELVEAASRLAFRDPGAAMRAFREAAELGARTGADGVCAALEAMGRIAAVHGDYAVAREALATAEREAAACGDAVVLARCRATLAMIERPRAYTSSAEAFAGELRFAGDLLDAAHIAIAPAPQLHAARARLEVRRRLALEDGRPPTIGRIEVAFALGPNEMAVLAICAALTLEPDIDRSLPPAALGDRLGPTDWSAMLAAWLAPAGEADVDGVLAELARHGLIRRDDAGRPELLPDVESLLEGRAHPVVPEGFTRMTATPTWNEGPGRAPAGPSQPPRVLAIVGAMSAAIDHATQLAWMRGWPLWIAGARPAPASAIVRGVRALAREARIHDRLLALAIDELDTELARVAIGEAIARLSRVVILAGPAAALPGDAVVLPAAPVVGP